MFDLGGVLAIICHNWQDAARTAGVQTQLPETPPIPLAGLASFDAHQAGRVDDVAYLQALASDLGVSVDEARRVHNGILVKPYPGTLELVEALLAQGTRLGCLSNTNEAHWQILTSPDHYPAIAKTTLQMASHRVGLEKPHAAIYRHYEQVFGLQSSQIVYFDDNVGNVEGAIAVGWRAHRINPNEDTAAQLRTLLAQEGVLGR